MMARALLLLALWTLESALVVLLVDAQWLDAQTMRERLSDARQLGVARTADVQRRAQSIYERWFVDTGAMDRSYQELLPPRGAAAQGTENLAPWFFRWLKARIDAFWHLVYQAIYRVQLLRVWAGMIGAWVACAFLDGLIRRQIRRCNHGFPSADRYLIARRSLLVLLFAPLLYLSSPLAVGAIAVPTWGLLIAVTCWTLASQAQHHV